MKIRKSKIAASLGILLAIPTILEGSLVLLGISKPNQIVLYWLVVYNVVVAVFSIYVVFELWQETPRGKRLAELIVSLHFVVFLVLIGILFVNGMVAMRSIFAMGMRSIVWGFINSLADRRNA